VPTSLTILAAKVLPIFFSTSTSRILICAATSRSRAWQRSFRRWRRSSTAKSFRRSILFWPGSGTPTKTSTENTGLVFSVLLKTRPETLFGAIFGLNSETFLGHNWYHFCYYWRHNILRILVSLCRSCVIYNIGFQFASKFTLSPKKIHCKDGPIHHKINYIV